MKENQLEKIRELLEDFDTAMLVTNADNIRGRLAIRIVIGSEDGLLEWSEKMHTSLTNYRSDSLAWNQVAELSFDSFMMRMRTRT